MPVPQIPYEPKEGDIVKREGGEDAKVLVVEDGRVQESLMAVTVHRKVGNREIKLGSLAVNAKSVKPVDKVTGQNLTADTVGEAEAYRIIGIDDPDWEAPVAPAQAWWKRKPNAKGSVAFEVQIFLKLPKPLEEGKRYRIEFPGVNLRQASVEYLHEPSRTRSMAVHVSAVGFRPDDPFKRAFLSEWLGTGGPLSYAKDLEFHLLDDATDKPVFDGTVQMLKATADKETFKAGRNYAKTDVLGMDFGAFKTPGRYRVYVEGIGPWQKRVPFHNAPWGRVDQNFVGVDEFIAFCRAVEAEPLVCVRWSGQKPSDAADLVEYCNGPAASPLGALRARNGHPEPYAVKYWQIGNEVRGDAYDNSVADFARAMRKADPSIRILASYISERLLQNACDLTDYVCPHHYGCADLQGTEADIRHYADLLQRFAPGRSIKLAVTEWNTTAGDFGLGRHRLWTLWNGLACARYLNLCHRYADLVKIACRSNISNSYCSGIIQTNNHAVYGTPAYHVARLYAEHGGTIPLAIDNPFPVLDLDISANLSADGKALSLIVVNPQGKPVVKAVNASAFRRVQPTAAVWTIADADQAGDIEATNSFERPERIAARASRLENAGAKFSYTFPAYSVTLIRLSIQE